MDILKKRWLYILNGFIVLLFMGCSLAWSIFVVPLETAFDWTRNQTSMAFTINILCFSVGSIMTGILSKYLSFSWLGRISSLMLLTGFIGTSFVSEVWQLYITYGVLVGTGIGLGYNCIISACPMWLPEKTATATGMLLMGYALSTAIFGPVLNSLIVSAGIVNTFRILGVVCGAGIFLGSFNLRTPTLEEIEKLPKVNKSAQKRDRNIITSEMVKMPIFWIYYIATSLLGGVGLVIVNHCSPMMIEGLAVTAAFAAMVVSITSISNGVARLLWGIIFDKIGLKKCMFLISGCFLLASVGMFVSFSGNITALFIMSACLMFFSYGGNAITCPTIIRELFGHRTFSLNYSIVATSAAFTSFFPSIAGMVQVATKGYHTPLFMLVVIAAVAVLTIVLFTRLYHKQYENT